MISNATQRSILRAVHLILSIPSLGYIYGQPREMQQYANATKFVFVPVLILSGLWMYAGVVFALISVALWLGVYEVSGSGAAIVAQVVLFIVWRIWLVLRKRRSKVILPTQAVQPAVDA